MGWHVVYTNVIRESKKGLGQSSPIWVIFFFCMDAFKSKQRQWKIAVSKS